VKGKTKAGTKRRRKSPNGKFSIPTKPKKMSPQFPKGDLVHFAGYNAITAEDLQDLRRIEIAAANFLNKNLWKHDPSPL